MTNKIIKKQNVTMTSCYTKKHHWNHFEQKNDVFDSTGRANSKLTFNVDTPTFHTNVHSGDVAKLLRLLRSPQTLACSSCGGLTSGRHSCSTGSRGCRHCAPSLPLVGSEQKKKKGLGKNGVAGPQHCFVAYVATQTSRSDVYD